MLTVRMCIKALQAPLSRKRSPFFPGLSSTWMGTQWSKHVLTNFFSEINLLASGLLRASELSFGDFPFIKHSEQKQSSRIIAQCLQHLLGGGWIKFPCVLYFFDILEIIPFLPFDQQLMSTCSGPPGFMLNFLWVGLCVFVSQLFF